jgi:hypothetical protein
MDVMRVVGRTPTSLAGARVGTVDVATVVMTDAFYCASPVSAVAPSQAAGCYCAEHPIEK